MTTRRIARIAVCNLCFLLFVQIGFSQNGGRTERVLISTSKPYDRVVAGIQSLGGKVKHQFTYVDGIAADIPAGAMAAVRNLVGANAISKDETVQHPVAADPVRGKTVRGNQAGPVGRAKFKSAKGIAADALASFAATHGDSYLLNAAGLDLDKLHAQGLTGRGVTVAVIDSGIRPGFPALESDNSVVGGADFVGDGLGFSNINNDPHGTFVASLISAKTELDLSGNPTLLSAIATYAPSALYNGSSIALIGSAPSARIYAVRVFGNDPNVGASESTVMAAIQHVIDKRKDFDRGRNGGLKIDICNLSLGNTTLAAGRDLFDRSVDALLAAGIVPVVSAGNAGPATLTTASPGTAFSALTVGAASFARNERIFQDVSSGEGIGGLWRPFSGTQTAYFSSRGPNADGRPDPDVMASGFANFSQGYGATSELSIGSGTSFSAPIVTGIAAVLRQAFPRAGAAQIRNAIAGSGDASKLADGSSKYDQGKGLVNAQGAYNLLAGGHVSDEVPQPAFPSHNVADNIEDGTNLSVQSGTVKSTVSNLKPGQRQDILYNVPDGTNKVVITLNNVKPSQPAGGQNALFGDDILLFVHSAKTSSVHEVGDYVAAAYTLGGTFIIDNPEPGILRVSVNGDWTNAGKISADVKVNSTKESLPKISVEGRISDSQTIVIPVTISSKISLAEFRLSWDEDWSRYPTNDVDMLLVSPDQDVIGNGATLNDPETVTLINPKPGTWLVVIDGFDLPAGRDHFKLTVALDHKVVALQ